MCKQNVCFASCPLQDHEVYLRTRMRYAAEEARRRRPDEGEGDGQSPSQASPPALSMMLSDAVIMPDDCASEFMSVMLAWTMSSSV